jgi:hypothetical protein
VSGFGVGPYSVRVVLYAGSGAVLAQSATVTGNVATTCGGLTLTAPVGGFCTTGAIVHSATYSSVPPAGSYATFEFKNTSTNVVSTSTLTSLGTTFGGSVSGFGVGPYSVRVVLYAGSGAVLAQSATVTGNVQLAC